MIWLVIANAVFLYLLAGFGHAALIASACSKSDEPMPFHPALLVAMWPLAFAVILAFWVMDLTDWMVRRK